MDSKNQFQFDSTQYRLIDFGEEQKLESFGGVVVCRETPSALGIKGDRKVWDTAHLTCGRDGKLINVNRVWEGSGKSDWTTRFGSFEFELRQTPTGQVGIFPEQATNWSWIHNLPMELSGLKALNLFGYTGGSTMALAARGAEVVHCDAAKSVVNWARSNARRSGLENAAIRWIVEDAMTFVRREIKRGNKYHIVVADPPTFGRGPSGESWKIQRDFEKLLIGLSQLTFDQCSMLLFSCHTPEFDHHQLASLVNDTFTVKTNQLESFRLTIPSTSGKVLPSGHCVRWFKPLRNGEPS